MNIVVVSPHRDDAAFSVGLSIHLWLAAGHRVTVLNCFPRSAYAPFAELDTVHPNDLGSFVTALRLREDQAWARQFHPQPDLVDLNLKDGPIRLAIPSEEAQQTEPLATDRAIGKIRRALDALQAQPQSPALVLPLGIGRHVDHLTARDASLPSESSPLAVGFYEDLPYSSRLGPGESVEAFVTALDHRLEPKLIGSAVEDIAAAVSRKRRMALCYDSQITDTTADEIAAFCQQYDGRERLWTNGRWPEILTMSDPG